MGTMRCRLIDNDVATFFESNKNNFSKS